jgi:hypothetical protein
MTSHTKDNSLKDNGLQSVLTQIPEGWLEGCKAVSSASQAMADRWIENRTEQIHTSLEAFTKVAACKNAGEIAEIQWRWMTETLDRFGAECGGYQAQYAAVFRQCFSGLGQRKVSSPTR